MSDAFDSTQPGLSADGGDGAPRHGDIVVGPDSSARARFTVYQVPGTPQMTWPTREAALASAKEFASRQGVDLWVSDGVTTSRLLRHQAPVPTMAPGRAATSPLVRVPAPRAADTRPATPEARRGGLDATARPSAMMLGYYARPRRRL